MHDEFVAGGKMMKIDVMRATLPMDNEAVEAKAKL